MDQKWNLEELQPRRFCCGRVTICLEFEVPFGGVERFDLSQLYLAQSVDEFQCVCDLDRFF